MYHTFMRYISAFLIMLITSSLSVNAQPCADTQPGISGSQAVTNSQLGVVYSTPNTPGHTYNWAVTGGIITSGMGTNQISVTWGAVGAGTVSVTETNPALNCSTTVAKNVKIQPLLVAYFYYTNTSCFGDMISFFASEALGVSISDPITPIASYQWDFGDGFTSVLANPTHTFLPPYNQTWNITLIVTNTAGYKDTIYDAVYVNPNQFIPTPAFTENIPNCTYQPVLFDASTSTTPLGTDSIIHYDWNFGDPSSPTNIVSGALAKKPGHVFTAPGTYTITLTVTNARYCVNTLTRTITITPSVPESRYTYSTPTCINNPTFFTDQSIFPAGHAITRWEWRFGDGSMPVVINSPALPDVSHTYPGLGPYSTWLITTNDLGCLDTIIKSIGLTPSPVASFTNSSNCFGDSVKFTSHSIQNNGPPITSYSWNFDDPLSGFNTSTNVNPGHLFSAIGDYDIMLIIQNQAGCSDTIVKRIHIYPAPPVEYSWNIGSQNNMVQFHLDQSVTPIGMIGNMVQWNFGDGGYGYGYDPVHIYAAGGTFNVTLTVTDTIGCSNSVTHQIYVPSLPVAFFSTNSPQCLGNKICFTDLSSAPTPPFGWITTWIWNYGDGSPNDTILFPNDPNICHIYATADTFAVTLKIFDNNGFTDSFTRDVIVLPNPVANFFFTSGCANQIVTFTDASTANGGGNVISYDWNFGDPVSGINNTSQLQNPIHVFVTGGTTYNVRLIISNFQGCIDTIIKPVYILAGPPVEFTHDTACLLQVVNFNANTGITFIDSIATWQWNFGDGSPLGSDPVTTAHLYTLPGTYTVTLTVMDKHGCISTIDHQVTVNPLPVAEFSWAAQSCQGASVQFTNQSFIPTGFTGFIAKWEWDFGDGSPIQIITIPTSPNVLHTFPSTAITYNVKLKVWSNDSCTKEITHIINLIATPVANFSSSTVTCEGQLVQYSDLSQTNGGGAIVSWSWDFNDPISGVNNLSTLPNPVHIFIAAGNYNVRLVVTNASGCKDTIVKTDTIRQLPVAAFTADTVCFGDPTNFTNTSIPNATSIITYAWDFGDGANSPLQSPTHTYASFGIFTVTLQITNSNGCIKSVTHQILVNPLPIAAFSYSTPNCQGAPVQFTNMSTTVPGYLGSIKRWIWDFGDGVILNIPFPSSPNVTHVFAIGALTHTVRLTVVTSDSCQSFIEHIVTSVPAPIASFSTPTSNCQSQAINFTDLSQPNGGGNIITWSWNFDDPTSGSSNLSSAQNPTHFFGAPGTYQVQLIVVNASNCSDTIQAPITIIGHPLVNFSADTACLTHPTTFAFLPNAASPGTIIQWAWEFGDGGTATTANTTHVYLSPGVFMVKLTVTTNEGCKRDTTKQILVLPSPIAAFSASAPTCASDSVQFIDLSSTGHGSITKWEWNFGDGNTVIRNFPASPNVKHLYTTGGTYQVTLTITTSDNCVGVKINPVIIQSAPLANFDFPTVRCADMPMQFNDLTQAVGGSPITQWLWNFDDPGSGIGNTSNVQNPVHSFSTSGPFDVVLYSTNASGCMDSIVKTVSVNAAPLAQFTASDTTCIGSLSLFTDGSTTPTGTITAWSWNFGDPASGTFNFSTLQNPTHSYASSGNYFVKLTVTNSNSCTRDTIIPITVYPKPNAMFDYSATCVGSETQFTDLSLAPGSLVTSWLWDFGDGVGTSTIQNPTYTYTASGTYQVKLRVTNLNNCKDSLTMAVVARPAPIANFNFTTFYCPQGQVNFQDESVGVGAAITERLWIFEPGYTSTLVNPTHIFTTTNATYAVTLIVTDNFGCKDTIVDSVFVKPGFNFSFTNDSVCFKTPTHFTPLNQTPGDTLFSLRWDFGDPASGPNNISYAYNGVHTYTQPGSYAVKLRAVDSDNCSDSIYRNIIVYALPQPLFSFVSTPCDSIIRFNEASTSGSGTISSWEWDFGDGSPSLIIPAPGSGDTSHQYVIGSYPVILKVTNSFGCTDTISKSVELYPCILANFSHDTTLLCARYKIAFSDSSLPISRINQWHWIFGDGLETTYIIHTDTLTHSYANAGTYNVSLVINATVSGKSFTDTMTQVITIRPTPLTAFSNIAVCANKLTLFRDTSDTYGSPVTNWSWHFGHPTSGTADTSTFSNPSHRYDAPGYYDVKLMVINQFGCKDSLIKTTRVHSLPTASFQSSLACSSNPTYFTDKTTLGDTTMQFWHWNFGDVNTKKDTAMVENPSYNYKDGGDYMVRMIVKDKNGCYDTVDSLVTVFKSPFSAFTLTDNVNGMIGKVLLNNQSIDATVYYWDFGNGKFSTDENPIVTYSEDGTYLIMLISSNQNECADTTFYKYEVLFKGLYIPNAFAPTSSNYSVMLFKPIGVNLKTYNIEVFDSWGHRVWSSRELDLQGRPTEGWNGNDPSGNPMPSGTYMWKANAMFIDGTEWPGSDIGKGEFKTAGTVTLIR